MFITEEIKTQFNKNGCYTLNNVLTQSKVSLLRNKVLEFASHETDLGESYLYTFNGDNKTQRVWNLANKGKCFRSLLEIHIIDQFMNFIFDRETIHQKYFLSSFQASIVYPGAQQQKLHIDTPFPEPLPPWPIKANTIWLLDDFTESNGATEYLPASHKLAFKPTSEDHKSCKLIKAIGKSGSVFVTHGNLWHRAGANQSAKPRIALLCSFAASYAREIASEEDHSKIISEEIISGSSEHLKKILGIGHGIKNGAFVEHE
jgi:ectoine hydroxylase-related dioxygenase (phytanoyl-CoA dioxygenase family)